MNEDIHMKLLDLFLFDILSWVIQKGVLYSTSVLHHMTQNCNCSCKVLGAASGPGVSGPRFGRSGVLRQKPLALSVFSPP